MNRMMLLFLISSLATTLGACGGDDTTTGSGGSGGSGGNTNTGSETGGTGGTGGAGGSGGASTGGSGGSGAGGSAGYTFSVTKGFNFAESCIWDAATDSWYVSNIAPQSDDLLVEDGEGWISRLDKDGAIVEEKWVSGFDSPAGLRISKGILYVANITRVHGIDIATAAVVETHTFPSAILLNDPAVDEANGMVYVTDTFGNAIYQFKAGEIGAEDVTVASPDLKGPNGLLFEGGKLLVGSLVDFDPANLGPFLSVDLGTKAIKQIGTVTGKFDGLEPWKDGYLLSDNGVSKLVYVTPDGTSEVLYDLMKDHGFAPAADIGIDPARGIICVPNLADSVGFVKIN